MNLGRVRHLLGFEWKRSRGLIFFGWFFLIVAFVPRLMTSARMWKMDWNIAADYLPRFGLLLYGLMGLQMTLRLSLMSRDWRGSRPLLAREIVVVKVFLLGAGFVLPLLLLSWVNLTLAGFATPLVWQNLGAIALGVVPLWLVWGLVAHYSGSIKTLVKITLILVLLNFATAFLSISIIAHWTDLAGYRGTIASWLGIWVTVIFLILLWPLCRRRSEGLRISTVVASALVGCGASVWMLQNGTLLKSQVELPAEVNWEGSFFTKKRDGEFYTGFPLSTEELNDGTIVVWESIHGMETISGTRLGTAMPLMTSLNSVSSQMSQEWLEKRLLPEGGFIESSRSWGTVFEAISESSTLSGVIGRVSDDSSTIGDEAVFSGRIRGAIIEFEKLCELEMGTDGLFKSDELIGEVQWNLWELNRGLVRINIRTNFTKAGLLDSDNGPLRTRYRLQNWSIYLYYPKSKVLQRTFGGDSKLGSNLGGMSETMTTLVASIQQLPQGTILDNEKPRLVIFRPRVLKSGYRDVTSRKLVRMDQEMNRQRSILNALSGPNEDRGAIEKLREDRPSPGSATQAEVGGWLRRSKRTEDYAPRTRDYAEFADQWGWLLVQTPGIWNGESYALGARNDAKEELVSQLGEVDWAPQVLVERGWQEAARTQLEGLVSERPNDEKLLSLGLMLELDGVEDLVIDKLSRDGSVTLYEIARQVPKLTPRLDAAMETRTNLAEKEFDQQWYRTNSRTPLRFEAWAVPLRHGKKESLEKFYEDVQRTQRARRDGWLDSEVVDSLQVSGKGPLFEIVGNLSADDFGWDALTRKWVIEKKGELKE
ncbi:hypothetical protein V2O64_14200 [Verrucomicrobiaceae bacterium 227]